MGEGVKILTDLDDRLFLLELIVVKGRRAVIAAITTAMALPLTCSFLAVSNRAISARLDFPDPDNPLNRPLIFK